jgi:hypothetical protein
VFAMFSFLAINVRTNTSLYALPPIAASARLFRNFSKADFLGTDVDLGLCGTSPPVTLASQAVEGKLSTDKDNRHGDQSTI